MRVAAPASIAFGAAAEARVRRPPPVPAGPPIPGGLVRPAKPGVLVVEDEPLVRFLIRDALESAGFDVGDASDADGALARFDTDRAFCRVLVTDLDLGPGPDGLALAAEARGRHPALRVLYVTGTPERVAACRTAGSAERVLGKPFLCAELVATVRWLLAPPPAGRSGPA